MNKIDTMKDRRINPDMTVLEVIDRYRDTEFIFKKYDERAGVCICCQALFETIGEVAENYHLNLDNSFWIWNLQFRFKSQRGGKSL